MGVPHATPQVKNGGWEYTFFFSLYELINFTLLTLPRVFFFLIAFNDNTWIG